MPCFIALLDFDECTRGPCKNGAGCINTYGSYNCKCTQGFSGNDCGTGEFSELENIVVTKIQSITGQKQTYEGVLRRGKVKCFKI